jgi:hypothetical protein
VCFVRHVSLLELDHETHIGTADVLRRQLSLGVDIKNSLGEGVWCFLRQIVPNAAVDGPMLVPA